MKLIDTSVWVDYLRDSETVATVELDRLLGTDGHLITTTEPIAMELLAGATDEVDLARLTKLVDGLPSVPVDPPLDFRAAAAIFRGCRRGGVTVRNLSDCLIAAVAIRADVELIHKAADFETIRRVSPLRATSWR